MRMVHYGGPGSMACTGACALFLYIVIILWPKSACAVSEGELQDPGNGCFKV